jgi:archaemetzincin
MSRIVEGLQSAFPKCRSILLEESMVIPEESFNAARQQYDSNMLLERLHKFSQKRRIDRVLGIADIDLFIPGLNFIFGQAECPGKAALISLWRLRPEYYGQSPSNELLEKRSIKEAIHEMGHTFGFRHCPDPHCVMHFSNTISDTDAKLDTFCSRCSTRALKKIR